MYGHSGDVAFSAEFSTWAQPKVLTVGPQGQSQPVESAIRVEFERDVDRAAVEESFRIEPAVGGTFEWRNERLLIWRPQGLQHSTWYKASVGGKSLGGDTFVGTEWSFETHDPPVFVEIKGRNQAPTVLEAFPSGGLGTFALQWSTGEVDREILFPGTGPAPHTVAVTVSSGDRTHTAAIEVAPAPNNGFTPVNCPPGWDLIEVSVCYRPEEIPGPIRTYTTRIDLKDPNLQARSMPAAGTLGALRPTSEEAKASTSMVTVNGDFFYTEPRGSYTLGPIVSGGNFFYAPVSPEVVLALGRDDSPWVGAASELRFALQSADGSAIPLQGVNHIPGEHAASLFNGYWGPDLNLEAEGCFAAFAPADQSPRVPDAFGCGPLAGITLPPGTFTIVARGAAAEWLQTQSANPLGVRHSFPLGNVDFLVSGSHILVAGGAQPALTPDKRNPRTAIGLDAAGFLYLLVVDGRTEKSLGMTLPELQAYVAQNSMTNAINLDGGGSSTLVLRETLMNAPADGKERPVASMVEVGPPRPRCRHPFVRC
jgi:Phosphodiester glycosidase